MVLPQRCLTGICGPLACLQAISCTDEDPSNKLLDVAMQFAWLREIALDVGRHCKWRELALLVGVSALQR